MYATLYKERVLAQGAELPGILICSIDSVQINLNHPNRYQGMLVTLISIIILLWVLLIKIQLSLMDLKEVEEEDLCWWKLNNHLKYIIVCVLWLGNVYLIIVIVFYLLFHVHLNAAQTASP